MSSPAGYTPEGRLGNPKIQMADDPRLNRKLAEKLASLGLDKRQPEPELTASSPMEQIAATVGHYDAAFQRLYDSLPNDIPRDKDEPEVKHSTMTIKGPDNNDIALHVFRRADTEGQVLPGLLYTHGGGMTIINTINPVHVRWLKSLAIAGTVAIAVEFRNAYLEGQHNPFPAGSLDCKAAIRYIASHKSDFGIDKIILTGESGGGNLALTSAIRANREGYIKDIDGVYAMIPSTSNGGGWPKERMVKELPSMYAHDGYILSLKFMEISGHYYTPTDESKVDPLAWPHYATEKDLKGLPPHHIAVDELDPLRDEGMAYARKLDAAGVKVTAHMNLGIGHGCDIMFRQTLPDHFDTAVDSVVAFARRV
ncbi:hypothetical protein BAUCODRAFT_569828 [Baudoinia panamericana UAMH 10762]|uniref:Alpha/beta hydrolase fold-3 domain-containing protein n=1 Tax=Baudoinia panamericana (strain UAMH 10762) TaxID=717646 RepID=M2M7V7_BAUPA|nr:uncharacterized protein BAUCODRAFT_569828 [Baudoinia panamericana UAMH 10762]EMC92416.1 hypothetical protein BAUCODRAFT_569828 [Baudoinia panamericana UAMH 10762]